MTKPNVTLDYLKKRALRELDEYGHTHSETRVILLNDYNVTNEDIEKVFDMI